MKVFRVLKDKNYTTINNTIFKDKSISCKTKGFFATIMSLPPDWDFSVNGIKEILLEGKSSVYSFIDELEDNGYLTKKTNRDNNGKILGVEYTFFETPINKELNPQTDLQETALQETAEPRMENRPQLSTNIIKDLNNKTISDNVIDFDGLLKLFNGITGRSLRTINTKARKQFTSLLKEGYSKDDIKNAIKNCFNDPYHKKNPKYLTPEFISRPDKFEKYFEGVVNKVELPKDWFHRELSQDQIKLLTPEQVKSWNHNKKVLAVEGGYLKPIVK